MATANFIPIEDPAALLKRFENHLYARCGMAEGTIGLTLGYIRRMYPITGLQPTQDALDDYIATMRRSKTSYGHLTNCMKAVEHYMRFIGDPIRFQRPRKPHGVELRVLSEGKIALIIAAAKDLRERTMVMVLAYTGCRNRELTNFRVRDVDIAQQTIAVHESKNERGRLCPLAGECSEVLLEYLRARNGQPEDFLFLTERKKHHLQTQDIRKMVRRIAKRAKVPGRIWPHLFRHSLATAMLARGASIYSIQAILGHTFVSTTMEYYLHPSARNVKADYHRCAPSFI